MNIWELHRLAIESAKEKEKSLPIYSPMPEPEEIDKKLESIKELCEEAAKKGEQKITILPQEDPFLQKIIEESLKRNGFLVIKKYPMGYDYMEIWF